MEQQLKESLQDNEAQAKEISILMKKLEKANGQTEQFLSVITNSITKNSIENNAHNNDKLAFWLSFSYTEYTLLKDNIPPTLNFDPSCLEKETLINDLNGLDPITRFFHELTYIAFDIYNQLLQNIFRKVDQMLVAFILDNKQKPNQHLDNDFINIIKELYQILTKYYIKNSIIEYILESIFYYSDAQLFNTLIKRPNIFTCTNGFEIKVLISQIENNLSKYCNIPSQKYFNYIKEASNLLIMDKSLVNDEETRKQIFPHLNIIQINHFIKNFKTDGNAPDPIPESVKRNLEEQCLKKNSNLSLLIDPTDIKKINLFYNNN